ncbi:MAG: tetratricopeptide repeat protein [Thermoguttaceae bacterium]
MRTRWYRLLSIVFCIALATALPPQTCAEQSQNGKSAEEKEYRPGPLILDDAPLPLSGNRAQDEAQRDKVEALALFSAARALELREQYAEALRLYQRALRYDPQSAQIARAIIPLAIHLNRQDVAIRYALKSVELDEDLDLTLLRRLGVRLEEVGDWPQALKLFQRALALHAPVEPNSADDVLLRMDTGRLLILTGNYKEAADCFALVVDALDHPDKYSLSDEIQKALLDEPGATYAFFGDCFLQAGRVEEARAAYEKAQKREPNEALWKFHLAQVLDKNGKPAEALGALEEAMAKHLSTAGMKPCELLDQLLGALGKKDELLPRLEKLRDDDPQNVPLGYFLADKYLAADMIEKAESLYVSLLDKSPAITGYKSLIEIYRKTKQYDALLSVLGELVEKTGVLDTLGSDAISLSKDPDAMRGLIDAARKQLKDAPEKPSYGKCFAMGLLAMDGKQWETAGEFFQPAVTAQSKKAAEVYLVWGVGLLVDNRPAESAKVFQQGIDKKAIPDDNPIFYFYLAGALAMDDRIDDALAAARKAAEIKKDSAKFRSRIAWVYFRAKQYDEAAVEYLKTLNDFDNDYQNEENRESLKEVRMELSNICVLQKKTSEAVEWLQQVLDEFPDDIGAMNDLGYLWADENRRLPQALKMIRKAVEAEPDNAAYRDSLGWALYRLGRWDEAVAELQKAAEKQPDGVIFDHLGDACLKFHQPEKARDAWRRAAELLRQDNDQEKAKESEEKMRQIDHEIQK